MVRCNTCRACAHELDKNQAIEDLGNTPCEADCENCKNLKKSTLTCPAVPKNGTCNDILHICPECRNRWWQSNTHFHLWQRVTSDREWEALQEDLQREQYFTESVLLITH